MDEAAGELIEVEFRNEGLSARVLPGATVMDAALLSGAWIDAPCGGEGTCGRCVVRVTGGIAPPDPGELSLLGEAAIQGGSRLSCRAAVTGACTVHTLPPTGGGSKAGLAGGTAVAVDLPRLSLKSFVAPPLGAAIDVGTTTLCVSIVDLSTGRRAGIASSANPQARFGADVMTRIDRCRREPEALGRMQGDVIRSLGALLEDATSSAGLDRGAVVRLVMVGNTTMLHLALGADPSPLGSYPFEPSVSGPVELAPSEIGLSCSSDARLLVPAAIAGFLGSDIVAVLLASGVDRSAGPDMVVDIGTNGEIAAGGSGGILACSTAAGPAFEGAEISHGMRAAPGAIDSLSRDGRLAPRVIGGGEPQGICGSGLLDAAAALLEAGLLLPTGRLAPPGEGERTAPGRIVEGEGGRAFVLAAGTGLTLTQEDVRQLQLAKSALRSGIQVLASRLGLGPGEFNDVYLAGVFGNFLRPASAARVGLLPAGVRDRVVFAGNAALTGAEMMLASEREWERANAIAERVEAVELSGDPDFRDAFIDNLAFPEKGVTS